MGGYFLSSGNEKFMRMLIMPRRNYVRIFSDLFKKVNYSNLYSQWLFRDQVIKKGELSIANTVFMCEVLEQTRTFLLVKNYVVIFFLTVETLTILTFSEGYNTTLFNKWNCGLLFNIQQRTIFYSCNVHTKSKPQFLLIIKQ